jgi:predicted nuclease of predicted toxin-antitoxin system
VHPTPTAYANRPSSPSHPIDTGNIKNSALEKNFATNLPQIIDLLSQHHYIEIGQDSIITHI